MTRPNSNRFFAPATVLGAGILAAAVTLGAGVMPVVKSPSSVARLPIPSAREIDLEAKRYALYFGLLNAPSRVPLHAPALSINITSPAGVADPDFQEVKGGPEWIAEGRSIMQIATITVHQAGHYTLRVSSLEDQGGTLSVGELPAGFARGPAFARAGGVLAIALLLAGVLWFRRR